MRRNAPVTDRMDVLGWLRKQLEDADADLLRQMVQTFAETLMGADADVLCGAPYGRRSVERVNRRNGCRLRRWDMRVGSIDLRIPKLREGSYFPDWLLDARTRAERAYLPGGGRSLCQGGLHPAGGPAGGDPGDRLVVQDGGSPRWPETSTNWWLSLRNRPLDRGPYTYLWAGALSMKVRQGGRVVNVACSPPAGTDTGRSSASTLQRRRTGPAG